MVLKCPKCGGMMTYDPATDAMKCDACEGLVTTDAFSTLDGREQVEHGRYSSFKLADGGADISSFQMEASGSPKQQLETSMNSSMKEEDFPSFTEELMETRIYKCSSCSAELMLNSTEASTFCGFCGAPTIVFDRISKEVKPQKIIPFKITETQAILCIKDRFGHGGYIPEAIRNLTVEKVRGIYMPYWLYDTYARKGIKLTDRTEDYLYISEREAECYCDNIRCDASLNLNNKLAERLEPFYMHEMADFDMAYLSGYYADKYDVPYDAMKNQIKSRTEEYIDVKMLQSTRFAHLMKHEYHKEDSGMEYRVNDVKYALLPAYFVNIRYEGKNYSIIVNGQTGRVVGNIPEDKKQVTRKFIKNTVISCAIFATLCGVFFYIEKMMPVVILPILVAVIQFFGGLSEYKKHKEGAASMAAGTMQSYINQREDY